MEHLTLEDIEIIGTKLRARDLNALSPKESEAIDDYFQNGGDLMAVLELVKTRDLRTFKPHLSLEERADIIINTIYYVTTPNCEHDRFDKLGYGGIFHYFWNNEVNTFNLYEAPKEVFYRSGEYLGSTPIIEFKNIAI